MGRFNGENNFIGQVVQIYPPSVLTKNNLNLDCLSPQIRYRQSHRIDQYEELGHHKILNLLIKLTDLLDVILVEITHLLENGDC